MIAIFLVILVFFKLVSTDYCVLQQRFCRQHQHIACANNTFPHSSNWKNFELIEMTPQTRGYILESLNEYRSRIALGRIGGFPTAGNMQIMQWHREFEFLMEEKVMKSNFGQFYCVATEEFRRPYENSFRLIGNTTITQFLKRAMHRFMIKNMTNIADRRFSAFYNAGNFKIGCALARYEKNGKLRHVLKCITNQWPAGTFEEAYRVKDPCSKCNDKNDFCDGFYSGLCVSRFVGPPGIRGPAGPSGPPAEDNDGDCEKIDDCD